MFSFNKPPKPNEKSTGGSQEGSEIHRKYEERREEIAKEIDGLEKEMRSHGDDTDIRLSDHSVDKN